jgi:hypothetical protein
MKNPRPLSLRYHPLLDYGPASRRIPRSDIHQLPADVTVPRVQLSFISSSPVKCGAMKSSAWAGQFQKDQMTTCSIHPRRPRQAML